MISLNGERLAADSGDTGVSGHPAEWGCSVAPSIDVRAAPGFVQGLRETCHDMRQPVASVFALAAAVLAEPGLPQAARVRLELIVEQAEWLADLIQHSLHGAGPGGSALSQADLLRVVREVVAAECVTWAGQVRTVSLAEPVLTVVHPVLLRRMVANLLSNATRAAGSFGTVTVEVGHQGSSALLAVEDTGPGFGNIPTGLGLGLAAVSKNANRYGGRLECGRGASGGARVSLWLPLVPGQRGQAVPISSSVACRAPHLG
jgi:signal transduction histidine kinase